MACVLAFVCILHLMDRFICRYVACYVLLDIQIIAGRMNVSLASVMWFMICEDPTETETELPVERREKRIAQHYFRTHVHSFIPLAPTLVRTYRSVTCLYVLDSPKLFVPCCPSSREILLQWRRKSDTYWVSSWCHDTLYCVIPSHTVLCDLMWCDEYWCDIMWRDIMLYYMMRCSVSQLVVTLTSITIHDAIRFELKQLISLCTSK